MAAAAKDKSVDMALIFGGKSKSKGGEEPPALELEAEEEPTEEGELPAGFMTAFEEYEAATDPNERAQAFYRAIEACKGM